MQPLLAISDLHVEFQGCDARRVRALNGVNLRLFPGEVTALLGESGCGKTTLARTVLGLLPESARITKGTVTFEERDLLAMKAPELQRIRGARISLIPQDPALALSPFLKAGTQIAEVLRAHNDWTWKRCREEAEALLVAVHLALPERRVFDAYPHQLSGGQQQRVVVAQAISCRPALIIADEPTSSLDAATEQEILDLFRELKARHLAAFLLITHDPKILRGLADRVAVMYAGRIVEESVAEFALTQPLHPYAKALLSCVPPEPGEQRLARGERLATIPGSAPDAEALLPGCSFAPRCESRKNLCEQRTPCATQMPDERLVECFLYER